MDIVKMGANVSVTEKVNEVISEQSTKVTCNSSSNATAVFSGNTIRNRGCPFVTTQVAEADASCDAKVDMREIVKHLDQMTTAQQAAASAALNLNVTQMRNKQTVKNTLESKCNADSTAAAEIANNNYDLDCRFIWEIDDPTRRQEAKDAIMNIHTQNVSASAKCMMALAQQIDRTTDTTLANDQSQNSLLLDAGQGINDASEGIGNLIQSAMIPLIIVGCLIALFVFGSFMMGGDDSQGPAGSSRFQPGGMRFPGGPPGGMRFPRGPPGGMRFPGGSPGGMRFPGGPSLQPRRPPAPTTGLPGVRMGPMRQFNNMRY